MNDIQRAALRSTLADTANIGIGVWYVLFLTVCWLFAPVDTALMWTAIYLIFGAVILGISYRSALGLEKHRAQRRREWADHLARMAEWGRKAEARHAQRMADWADMDANREVMRREHDIRLAALTETGEDPGDSAEYLAAMKRTDAILDRGIGRIEEALEDMDARVPSTTD